VACSAAPGGGLLTLQILNILGQFDLAALEHGSPDHAYIVGAALSWVGVTRGHHHTDPAFTPVPIEQLLSEEHAEQIAARIRRRELPDRRALNMPGFTTHLSVMDSSWGTACPSPTP
jgi:gamma-glutamyltranspeptidase / glutathione hydrolase